MKKNTKMNLITGNRLEIKMIGLLLLIMFAAGCITSSPSKSRIIENTITIVDLPTTNTDGAIGIQPSKIYTHTLDFGTNAPVIINGVAFDQGPTGNLEGLFLGTSSQGYGYIIDDSRAPKFFRIKPHGGKDPEVDGNSAELLRDMIYHSNAQTSIGESLIMVLQDLVPGTAYSVRYYYRAWDPEIPRSLTINFNDVDSIDVDIDGGGAHYIDYTFTAMDSDLTINFIYHEGNQGAHIYGLTCEEL